MSTKVETLDLIVPRFEVKQLDLTKRTFQGLAATWDEDLGGDIIEKGAFAATLEEWKGTGRIIYLLDSHNWFSVRDAVGKLLKARETSAGLLSQWKIVPGADGDEVLARLSPEDGGPFIDSMSIGYKAVRWEMVEDEEDEGVFKRILKEIELHEVSLVLFPMNPAARIDADSMKRFASSVKSLVDKAPEGVRDKLRTAVREQLTIERPAKETPTPKGKNDDEPDFNSFNQLRLRRLNFSSHTHQR
jgi:hypothetical protein